MDEMDHKRGMVKLLLDMLKHSASKEVGDGLHVDKIAIAPHGTSPEEAMKMADGGMPAKDDEPGELLKVPDHAGDGDADTEAVANLPGPIEDEEKEREEDQALHNANIMDEDEDSNQSAFNAFLPRKRKK